MIGRLASSQTDVSPFALLAVDACYMIGRLASSQKNVSPFERVHFQKNLFNGVFTNFEREVVDMNTTGWGTFDGWDTFRLMFQVTNWRFQLIVAVWSGTD